MKKQRGPRPGMPVRSAYRIRTAFLIPNFSACKSIDNLRTPPALSKSNLPFRSGSHEVWSSGRGKLKAINCAPAAQARERRHHNSVPQCYRSKNERAEQLWSRGATHSLSWSQSRLEATGVSRFLHQREGQILVTRSNATRRWIPLPLKGQVLIPFLDDRKISPSFHRQELRPV